MRTLHPFSTKSLTTLASVKKATAINTSQSLTPRRASSLMTKSRRWVLLANTLSMDISPFPYIVPSAAFQKLFERVEGEELLLSFVRVVEVFVQCDDNRAWK